AGYAGVGWTFSIGGSILHSINGLNDEGHESDKQLIYNYINKLPPYNDQSTATGKTVISHFLENLSNGIFDGEPDKYSVNIGNISCSFYLDKDNNPIFLKNENYKLSGNSAIGFTLTDNQGINYIFNLLQGADKVTENDQYSYVSSYLITEINFPYTSNKILFKYSSSAPYNDTNFSQSLIKTTNESGNPNNNFILRNNTTTTILNTFKLDKIITNSGTIDLQYNSNPAEQAIAVISNLSVKDQFSKSVKSYDFAYSGWVGRRTNLLNVKYNGSVINEMEYDMSLPYPVLESNYDRVQKDLWGYYNKNGTMVSANGIIDSYNNPKLKPDFESTKIGSLTRITYQTKGYSLIEYEPNTVYMGGSNFNFPYDSDGLTISKPITVVTEPNSNEDEGSKASLIFDVTDVPTELIAKYRFVNYKDITSVNDLRNASVNIYENDQIALTASQTWTNFGYWNPSKNVFTDGDYNIEKKIKIFKPGTYKIEAVSMRGIKAELSVTLNKTVEFFNQIVGGLRVKQIKNCDFNGECITTVYNYSQNGKSTGLMLQKPEFYSGYSIQNNTGCSQGTYTKQSYFNFTSIYPLSNYKGSPVLYKTVEKTDYGKNENSQVVSNGKTIFSYYGKQVSNSLQDEESYFSIGLLDTKLVKDELGAKAVKQKNYYLNQAKPDVSKFVYSFQCKAIYESRGQASGSGGSSGSGCGLSYPRPLSNFMVNQFRHEAKNYILEKEESTNYYHGDSLVQANSYNYNLNTGFLKSQITTSSGKEALETRYFYPTDIDMSNEPFRNELISGNIIGTPLVTQNYNGEKLSDQKTEYDYNVSTSNFLVPKYVYANKGIDEINKIKDKKITYDKYDNKGNIVQYTLESGVPISIIWGYNKTQPIAKIENATYDQIFNYVDNLQNLSNADDDNCMSNDCNEQILRDKLNAFRGSFPEYMITTYTYNPLVGVTSVTDTKGVSSYYEYDSVNRLKFIKDKYLNVLQKYCYNYKGQQIDCSDNSSTSIVLYKSIARSGSFTKSNCSSGGTGASVIYNQPAGAVISGISQLQADSDGLIKFNIDGQLYANNTSSVKCTFWNTAQSGVFTRNNCAVGGSPETITYNVSAGLYSSTTSQAAADSQAQVQINNNGQAYANSNGKCTFYSIARSGSFIKNNCTSGGAGSSLSYSQAAGAVVSTISQTDADASGMIKFNTDGQNNANAYGTCSYVTYTATINDYEAELKKAWIVLTASSANHPARSISVKIKYDYPTVNTWANKTVVINFEEGQTTKIFEVKLNFISEVQVVSFTVN
ncbi:hypothetical protein B0A64_24680, partial [Flavobacterium araucananum]